MLARDDGGEDAPFSMYLNSIVPESGLLLPSRGMFGLKGAQVTKAVARAWSVTCGGRPEM